MEQTKYDIFISYRREGGDKYARTIQQALEKRYRVFLDFDELKDGVFDQRIIDAIRESSVFLLILSRGALDRCVNENDWVRQEILQAAKCGCHIVPVTIDDTFEGMPASLPEELRRVVGQHQFSELQMKTLFKESIDKMVRERIKPWVTKESTNTSSREIESTDGAEIHIEVDANCDLYRFKKLLKALSPNEDNIVYLKPGKHKIEFISHEYSDIKESMLLDIPYENYSDFITVSLLPQIQNKKEEEVRRKVEEAFIVLKDKSCSILQNLANNMVCVEGGSFFMGNSVSRDCDAFEDEMPIHEVNVSSFYICKYEVTQEEWVFVMGNNPSLFTGSKRPVDNISWDDCQLFIEKLNELTGKQFRLPTEAEWEYAARGGILSHGFKYAGSNIIQDVAWFEDNSNGQTHEVGSKMPNELGLFDMSGNVFEWCQDWYGNYPIETHNNPSGPISGEFLINRGGSWNNLASNCRVTDRLYDTSTFHDNCSGLRLAHNYAIASKPQAKKTQK